MYIVEDRWRHTFMKLDDARAFAMKTMRVEYNPKKDLKNVSQNIVITKHSFTDDKDIRVGIVNWGVAKKLRNGTYRYNLYWHRVEKDKDYPLNKDGSLARSWDAFYKQ